MNMKYRFMDVLFESKRDDFLNQYLPLLQKRGFDVNLGQLKSILLKKFADEFGIHSLSKGSNYYLAGVTRYYFEGSLPTNKRLNVLYPNVTDKPISSICNDLDILIDILRNSYIDSVGTNFDQPEDFGTLPIDKLLKKYRKKIEKERQTNAELQADTTEAVNTDAASNVGTDYTYQIIYSQGEVKKFERYTSPGAWCITYNKAYYNDYIRKLDIHYIVFMRKGFESVPRETGPGFTKQKPHDEYGNSLICVLQSNESPEPVYITSRWNHGSSVDGTQGTEADYAYTKEEFLNVIGADESIFQKCYDQWKNHGGANNAKLERKKQKAYFKSALLYFKYAQMMLNNGAQLKNFFNDIEVLYGSEERPNKSISLVGVNNNDFPTTIYTLYDRGRLLFDGFLYADGTKPTASILKNIIVFEYDHRYKFYNIQKHKLLNAEGVFEFKGISEKLAKVLHSENRNIKGYFIIHVGLPFQNGAQVVLDGEKGTFIQTPDNHTLFNELNNHDNKLFVINSKYFFDAKTGIFLDMPYSFYDENTNEEWKYGGSSGTPEGYLSYVPKNFRYGNLSSIPFKEIFINIKTHERLNILGCTEFKDSAMFGNTVFAFTPAGADTPEHQRVMYYYDLEKKELLSINGHALFCGYSWAGRTSDDYIILNVGMTKAQVCVYDMKSHEFIQKPTGNYIFKSAYGDYEPKMQCFGLDITELNGEQFFLPAHDIRVKQMMESVKKSFYDNLKKLWR